MAKEDERDTIYEERFINASFSFWNSLITLDAFILGITAIMLGMHPNINLWIILPVLLFPTLSIILIIWNFLKVKSIYNLILTTEERYKDVPLDKMDELFAEEVDDARSARKHSHLREKIALVFIGVSIILVFTIIIISYK